MGGRFLATHTIDIRVTRGLKERQSAGQNEVGQQEGVVHTCQFGREEHKRTDGKKAQSHHDARLKRVALDKHGGREGHGEIAQIEGHLYQGAFCDAHAEDLREGFDDRTCHVVGKAPEGKTRRNQNKWHQKVDAVFGQYTRFHVLGFLLIVGKFTIFFP